VGFFDSAKKLEIIVLLQTSMTICSSGRVIINKQKPIFNLLAGRTVLQRFNWLSQKNFRRF
jgi:hypothetical protein